MQLLTPYHTFKEIYEKVHRIENNLFSYLTCMGLANFLTLIQLIITLITNINFYQFQRTETNLGSPHSAMPESNQSSEIQRKYANAMAAVGEQLPQYHR